jgi:hypothetical protein
MAIGGGHDDRHRDATAVDQQHSLAALFSPICWVWPDSFLGQWGPINALPAPGDALRRKAVQKVSASEGLISMPSTSRQPSLLTPFRPLARLDGAGERLGRKPQ